MPDYRTAAVVAGCVSLWLAAVLTSAMRPAVISRASFSLAIAATIIAGLRSRTRPRLRPGQRIISDDEFFRAEEAITRAVLSSQPERGSERKLRSVL